MLRLENVNDFNMASVLALKVRKDQEKFVSSNACSLIDHARTLASGNVSYSLAIILGQEVIGFVLLTYFKHLDLKTPKCYLNSFTITRFMIDEKYQGKGYGKEAFKLVLDFIRKNKHQSKKIYLSYEKDNIVAKNLYASFNFRKTNEEDEGEVIACLRED